MGDRNGCVGGLENMVVQGNVVWTEEHGDEMVGVNGSVEGKLYGHSTRLFPQTPGVTALASTVKFLCSRVVILCSLYDIQWPPVGALLCPMVAHYFAFL
jgi:hypothetical protein